MKAWEIRMNERYEDKNEDDYTEANTGKRKGLPSIEEYAHRDTPAKGINPITYAEDIGLYD